MSSAKQEVPRETRLHENSHGRVELESPSFRAGRVSIVRLALEADHAAMHAGEARRQRRRTAIAELSGSLTGVYEPGYLDVLRQDWPH